MVENRLTYGVNIDILTVDIEETSKLFDNTKLDSKINSKLLQYNL